MELSVMTVLVPTDSAGCLPIYLVTLRRKCGFSCKQRNPMGMVGRIVSHVHVFLNKFTKLGFIEHHGGLEVHSSLLSVILQE
jgi:hypothetical protein